MRNHSWARGALGAAAVALAAVGCGGSEEGGDPTLRVYVSLPLRGLSSPDGRDAADGARLALADSGDQAGGVAVEGVYLDDTEGRGGAAGWTPAKAAANARRASQDSTAIAYLGDFESGATRASVPVTNEARLLHVSPASGAVDLVAPFPGSSDVPEVQPSGERSFGRVIPSDSAQGRAAAAWVERLGVRRVATGSDQTRFGKDLVSAFEGELDGVTVVNRGAGLLYYGGEAGNQPAALAGTVPRLMVSDAGLEPGVFEPPGTLATAAALDPSQLPPAGRDLAERFESEYGRPPGRYAAYGYEAMAVILDSIERASDPLDRAAVIEAFFATGDRDSVVGDYSIDELGETTLDRMTGYELRRHDAEPVIELSATP